MFGLTDEELATAPLTYRADLFHGRTVLPNRSGIVTPRKPMRPSAGMTSGGHQSSLSMRPCNGCSSCLAKRVAPSRISCCSNDKPNCDARGRPSSVRGPAWWFPPPRRPGRFRLLTVQNERYSVSDG